MVTLKYQVVNDQAVIHNLQNMDRVARGSIAKALNKGAEDIANSMKAKVQVDTGFTKGTVKVVNPATSGDLNVEVHAGGASVFLEEGTKPHVIVPKLASMLAWEDPIMGMMFASMVHHPGTKPYPFVKPAIEEHRPKIVLDILRELKIDLSGIR